MGKKRRKGSGPRERGLDEAGEVGWVGVERACEECSAGVGRGLWVGRVIGTVGTSIAASCGESEEAGET